MGVKFKAFTQQGDTLATSFTDTFIRANQNGWGNSWIPSLIIDGYTNNPGSTQWTINTNRGRVTDGGGAGSENFLTIPRDLIWLQTNRRRQFCQITFSGNSGTGMAFGPAVLANPNTVSVTAQQDGLYVADIRLTGTIFIRKVQYNGLWTATTEVALTTVAQAIVAGDVIRLEANPGTGTSIDLTLKLNGTVIGTATDTTATRINIGMPGLWGGINVNGQFFELSNFSCGLF